jgi:hypothetical protein
MGLFKVFEDIISLPVRAVVDVAKLPGKIVNGEDELLRNLIRGLEKIEEDLED